MAIVKGPLHSEQASGNCGSSCYTSWRGVAVVRSAWSGTYPGTAKQLTAQGRITSSSQAWGQTLTQAMRDKWNELAEQLTFYNRLGQAYKPTGYIVFIQRSIQRERMGWSTTGLIYQGNGAIDDSVSYVITEAPGNKIRCYLRQFDNSAIIASAWEIWVAGPYTSEARYPIEPEYKYNGHAHDTTNYPTSVLLQDRWYWVRLRWVDYDGRVGNWKRIHHFLPL